MALTELIARSLASGSVILRNAETRFNVARAKAQAGNYKADDLVIDLASLWNDTLVALDRMLTPTGVPIVSFAFTAAQVALTPTASKSVYVSVAGSGGPVTAPQLRKQAGGNKKIDVQATLAADGALTVTLTNLAGNGPDAGLYEGLASVGQVPLALLVVQVE